MGTDKRERKKANRAAKLAAEEAAAARARRIRTIRNVVAAGVLLVAVMLLMSVLSGCSSNGDDEVASVDDATTTAPAEEADGDEPAEPTAPTDEPTPCETAPDGVRVIDFDEQPPFELDPSATYLLTFETSEGDVVVELDTERTPNTTANFLALVEHCYFDGTSIFRTEVPSGVIQGGSPRTQDNSDPGPGYTIADEGGTFTTDDYGPGTLAMARTAEPNSASSQFFFLASEAGRYLGDPDALGPSAGTYVKFGQVTEGLDVLETIVELDDGSGTSTPSRPVTIERVTFATA
jgi:cyclophilin family peptidyl-prolyl cis-trans isomerase